MTITEFARTEQRFGHETDLAATEAQKILASIDTLYDPKSEFFNLLYGENSQPTHIKPLDRPHGGHLVYTKDETAHGVVADGSHKEIATFKRRGALAAALKDTDNTTELVTASAGNHGIGVAAAAKQLGLKAKVYATEHLSSAKRAPLLELGAEIIAESSDISSALEDAKDYTLLESSAHFIHPFDQTEVIAGQATVGTEILEDLFTAQQNGELDLHTTPITIVLPEGGGGLAAGVAVVFEQARSRGEIGKNVTVASVSIENKLTITWCDGTATELGEIPSAILNDERYVQHRLVVSELEVAEAMHILTGANNKPTEPAGALGYAGVRQIAEQFSARNGYPKTVFITPITGANVSKDTYDKATAMRNKAYFENLRRLGELIAGEIFEDLPENQKPATSFSRKTIVASGWTL